MLARAGAVLGDTLYRASFASVAGGEAEFDRNVDALYEEVVRVARAKPVRPMSAMPGH